MTASNGGTKAERRIAQTLKYLELQIAFAQIGDDTRTVRLLESIVESLIQEEAEP